VREEPQGTEADDIGCRAGVNLIHAWIGSQLLSDTVATAAGKQQKTARISTARFRFVPSFFRRHCAWFHRNWRVVLIFSAQGFAQGLQASK
jgi:hypothetical protein